MTVTVRVWSDYVCPYCFLAEQPLADAIAQSGVDAAVSWMPFELRPEPTPTLRPEDDYLQTGWARSVYPMAAEMGVEIRLPDVSPQPYSRLAFEGHLFAEEHGQSAAYTHRMFSAFFQESLDIGDIDILTALAQEIALDGAAFRTALEDGTYAEMHQMLLRVAYEQIPVTAVPTFLIGNRLLRGLVPIDGLIEQLRAAALDPTP
ncbi:MAG: DsbA family protein [Alphaproteobacteria bacterium]